jgi:hypothetical protein
MRWLPGALLALLLVAACGEEPSSDGPVIDVRAGTVDGAGLGDPLAAFARYGRPRPVETQTEPPDESELDVEEVGRPWMIDTPPRKVTTKDPFAGLTELRGQHLQASALRDRTYVVGVTVEGAHTREGVRIGDDLDAVKEAYDGADCGIRNEGTEYVEYPYCRVRVRPGRVVWFGQDPIRSITIASVALG